MALFSTAAICGARLTRVAGEPGRTRDIPAYVAGRMTEAGAYQWPGVYFEARFKGRSVYFRTGPGKVIFRALVDGKSVGTLVKPSPGLYLIDGLTRGAHTVRIASLTESQEGPNEFGGFALKSGKPLATVPRELKIEFIGDSHTVGYGNTSSSRDCTGEEVWATTDNTQAFGARVAAHYDADYQVNAISGRGIVRNYDGGGGDPLPVAYPFALFTHDQPYAGAGWHPQIIVIALGTNDFSTPLKSGEKWATRAELRADYEATYVKFVEDLRARSPLTYVIVWAAGKAEDEIVQEAGKVVAQLRAKGEERVTFISIEGLEMTACHWHPSVADDAAIAEELIHFIDDRGLAGARP
jgi:lysophospholipase L1-like esterase